MSTVPANLTRYRIDLVEAIDRELEHARSARLQRGASRRRHFKLRTLLAVAAVAGTALLVLTVAEPWHGSPTIIDRAEAAFLAPTGGQILYESVTVRRVPASSTGSISRVRLWLDSATHRFRMTFSGPRPAEVGGTLGSSTGLNYVPSTNALYQAAFQFRVSQSDLDPAAFIRSALQAGRAKLAGKATVRGHEVIRIQFSTWFNAPTARRLEPIALYYVDADTYRPVRIVTPPPYGRVAIYPDTLGVIPEKASVGFPMDPSAFLAGFPGVPTRSFPAIPRATTVSAPRAHLVYDFDAYRLLAPTAANRKLTSVRAMRDDVARYASGFRAASTPVFRALFAYAPACLGVAIIRQLSACTRRVAEVRATLPRLLRFVTGNTPPASSLPSTKADLRRLVASIRGLQHGFAALAALIAANDFVNPSAHTGAVKALYTTIADLQADIPELRLRFP